MRLTKIANIISFILGPHIWITIVFVLLMTQTGLSVRQIIILVPAILLINFILEIVVMGKFLKKNFLDIWELPIRQDRLIYLFFYLLSSFICLILIYLIGTHLLFKLAAELFLLTAILSLITLEWKISLHMAMNMAGALLVNILFDWSLPFVFICIPLVFWARLHLKRHTPAQLLGGAIVSIIFILGPDYLFPLK